MQQMASKDIDYVFADAAETQPSSIADSAEYLSATKSHISNSSGDALPSTRAAAGGSGSLFTGSEGEASNTNNSSQSFSHQVVDGRWKTCFQPECGTTSGGRMVWSGRNWISPSGDAEGLLSRYIVLLPLQWGARREFVITLARDTATGTLVMIRHYHFLHPCTGPTYYNHMAESEDMILQQPHVPFSNSWKRRVRSLLSLHHQHLMPITDLIMDNSRHELLLVHPYLDGIQPLACALYSYPYLVHRTLTQTMVSVIVLEVVGALLFLHKHGVVHGTLSPWTVLLTVSGHVLVTGLLASDLRPPIDEGDACCSKWVQSSFYTAPEMKGQQRDVCLPTEASDAFSVGALILAMTWEMDELDCVDLRDKAIGLMHRCPTKRTTLSELHARLMSQVPISSHQMEKMPQERGNVTDCDGETQRTSSTRAPRRLSAPPVVGILQRSSSPVLQRKTGLEMWMLSRTSPSKRGKRVNSVTLFPVTDDKFNALQRWRVLSAAVLFVVLLLHMKNVRRTLSIKKMERVKQPTHNRVGWERGTLPHRSGLPSQKAEGRRPRRPSVVSRRGIIPSFRGVKKL
uniref:Protein kinase domain-containing protein n=1 Tax=Trypanosoma congolense (strain IL3000) TaxID=1068625 RepID=G0UPW4_TRYCI|nr:conserved hypothetical protein [Trypanosoma congolense IL3000]